MARHFGWSPPGLHKACCPTPSPGTVLIRNGNRECLKGLAVRPKLAHVVLQLVQGLHGNLPPVVGLVEAAARHIGPLPVMPLRVIRMNGGVHPAVQRSGMPPGKDFQARQKGALTTGLLGLYAPFQSAPATMWDAK